MAAEYARNSASPSRTNSIAARSLAATSCSTWAIFNVGGAIDIAAVGVQLAANRRKQTRLPRAVGAGDPDLVAAEDGEIDLLEQRLRTAPQGEIPSR